MDAFSSTRLADPANIGDIHDVARLLHDFNEEFETPTPSTPVLAERAHLLLSQDTTFAVLAGKPAVAIALVTLRPNIWHSGPVALLDELYVAPHTRGQGIGTVLLQAVREEARERGVELIEINVDEGDVDARRFYERNGFSPIEPDTGELALYYQGSSTTG